MRYFLSFLIVFVAFCSQGAIKHSDFARSSRLASGTWVKVGIGDTGIYEISYEQLRNMGFKNPSRVGVYGRGGAQSETNFTTATGSVVYHDDIQPVAVLHLNDKLYFYGQGSSAFKPTINSTSTYGGGFFRRESFNIYASHGYYFLSDYKAPKYMETVNSAGAKSLTEYTYGVNYVNHEVDLYHNNSNTGQLFYGEKMTPEKPRLEWDLDLPGAIPGTSAYMECFVYTDKIKETTIGYGIDGGTDNVNITVPLMTTTDFTPHSPSNAIISVPGERCKPYVEIGFNGNTMDVSNLDYWTISYARQIPTLVASDGSRMAQDRIYFPRCPRPQSGFVRVPNGIDRIVFDITDPTSPKYVDLLLDGSDGLAKFTAVENFPALCIIDPLMPQLSIISTDSGANYVTNQDIHAQAAEGADLIIICIPQLRESAERLADLHRRSMKQRVIVATTEEVYNEFSSGVPDPMAYRALAKMAYTSEYGCKNILLLGPLYADFRGITVDKNPQDGIIAIQSATTSQVRGGFNTNDFYGIMLDYLGAKTLESCNVAMGVGILPARYPAEVDTYIEKVAAHMNRSDYAYTLNKYLMIGGYGDSDLHSSQIPEINNHIASFNKSVITSPLIIDAYGFKESHDALFNAVDEGVSVISYFGHGGPLLLNKEGSFFCASDVYSLRNKTLPLWGFAGCELTEPDKGVRGMGESLVLSTPYGMIGSLLATRETWSSQNLDFFKKFHSNLLRKGGTASSKMYEKAPTIGEIYAGAKQLSTYANELAYQLLCDPAIVIPTVNRDIFATDADVLESYAGNYLEFSGIVKAFDNDDTDTNFNGEVVARLMEPAKVVACAHVISSNDKNAVIPDKPVKITYPDNQLAMSSAEVTNGEFHIKLFVPRDAAKFGDNLGRIYLSAYDPSSRLGAGGYVDVHFISQDPGNALVDYDVTPPAVEAFEYLPTKNAIRVRVTDDVALASDTDPFRPPFRMRIDDNEYRAGATTQIKIQGSPDCYEKLIPLADIATGSHRAWISVRDAAGNVTIEELMFDYNPLSARYQIALQQTAVDGFGDILSVGQAPAQADIVILDNQGFIVCRAPFVNGAFSWDATGLNGEKVSPGLYKAYIIETGDTPNKGHSATIDIPVI